MRPRARFDGRATACLLSGLLLWASACGGGASHRVVRTLHGSTTHGAFVPPYAYEAYVRGELLLEQGQAREAVAQLKLAATAPDEDPYLLSRLAHAQLLAGDRAEAERTLEHAAELDRCSEAVWLMRGTLAETTQELAVARAAYENASSCAPRSAKGELALVHLLLSHGETAAGLDVLTAATDLRPRTDPRAFTRAPDRAVRPAVGGPPTATQALARASVDRPEATSVLRHSLATMDATALAHALGSLGAQRAPDSLALEQAVGLALDRNLPRLALRLSEQHPARLPAALQARLLSANGKQAQLAVLVAESDAEALGGHERVAQIALDAQAYERAELESTSALSAGESDAMHAVRARSSLALRRTRAALSDMQAVRSPQLRHALLTEALAAEGAPALAKELSGAFTGEPSSHEGEPKTP